MRGTRTLNTNSDSKQEKHVVLSWILPLPLGGRLGDPEEVIYPVLSHVYPHRCEGNETAGVSCLCVCVCVCVCVSATQPCPTLCASKDCSPPGSSVHGILQVRILEWVVIPFSRGIFPTQGSNPGLLCYRLTPHRLSHQGRYQMLRKSQCVFFPVRYWSWDRGKLKSLSSFRALSLVPPQVMMRPFNCSHLLTLHLWLRSWAVRGKAFLLAGKCRKVETCIHTLLLGRQMGTTALENNLATTSEVHVSSAQWNNLNSHQ